MEVEAVSSAYETEPVGEILDQPDFLNAAVRIRTSLEPEALLDVCKGIEAEHGRAFAGPRHGPRPLDIDLRGRTIGLLLDAGAGTATEPQVRAAVETAAKWFADQGATVKPVAPVISREILDGLDDFFRARSFADLEALPAETRAMTVFSREEELAGMVGAFPDARINIDCKANSAFASLVASLKRLDCLDRVCLGGFSDQRLRRLRAALGDRLVTTADVGQAMLAVARRGAATAVLEARELHALARAEAPNAGKRNAA